MDLDRQEFWGRYRELCMSPGWKQFQEGIDSDLAEINNLDLVDSEHKLWFNKGQKFVLEQMSAAQSLWEQQELIELEDEKTVIEESVDATY